MIIHIATLRANACHRQARATIVARKLFIETTYFLNTFPLRIYSISGKFKRALTTRAAANK